MSGPTYRTMHVEVESIEPRPIPCSREGRNRMGESGCASVLLVDALEALRVTWPLFVMAQLPTLPVNCLNLAEEVPGGGE